MVSDIHTLILHDYLNPARLVPMDYDDFSTAAPYLSGSLVYRKSSDSAIPVHETPEEIADIRDRVERERGIE